MQSEVVAEARSIWEKLSHQEWSRFTAMDIIFIAGVITLLVVAAKLVRRFFKVLFVLLAVALVLLWLYNRGLIQ